MLQLESKKVLFFNCNRGLKNYMKKFLTIFAFIMTSFCCTAKSDLRKIERLVHPYENAIEFVTNLDLTCRVNDTDISMFFSENNLYQKKDIKKFNDIIRRVKNLTYNKKSLVSYRDKLENLIDNLEKVQTFITDYATMNYVLINYNEIASRYFYIDEQHKNVIGLTIRQSEKLGWPNMEKGRGLYKFVKKIDLDLRHLTKLFVQCDLSDDIIIKMNHMKTKLTILKSKIVASDIYKSQLRTTRLLKTFGVIGLVSVITISSVMLIMFTGGSIVWI